MFVTLMDGRKVAGSKIQFLDWRLTEVPENVLIEGSNGIIGHIEISQFRQNEQFVVRQ